MKIRDLVQALSDPGAYPHPAHRLRVHHTHISVVFLAGEFAYKVKKPVDLGFLDFTTLQRRRRFCHREVELNRRLAPGVYLGVVPIVSADGDLRVGSEVLAEGADRDDGGEVLEYAVKMERLPPGATLLARLRRREVGPDHARLVARRIADFHARARGGPEVARYGRHEVVAANARENFEQSTEQIGHTVASGVFQRLRRLTERHLSRLEPLVERRARQGRPRDTHGDLHLDHVYHFPERRPPRDLVVVDCIEFNDRFRYADPVSDMAFLAMDLAYRGRRDLAEAFVDAYLRAADDPEGHRLVPFYVAYRAAVRGKVEGMTAVDPDVPEEERRLARAEARAHWLLALDELEAPDRRPGLVLVGGLPGTGKTTLAGELAREAGFHHLSSDRTRKRLAGLEAPAPASAGFEEGIYRPAWTERTYRALEEEARARLLDGERVVVDASFREAGRRADFLALARRTGCRFLFLLCTAEPATVRRRMRARSAGRSGPGPGRDGTAAPEASDADWEVYQEAARRWESSDPEVQRRTREVSTEERPEETLRHALRHLREAGLRA